MVGGYFFQLLRYLSETIMTTIKWREKVKKKEFRTRILPYVKQFFRSESNRKYIKVKNNEIICHQETYTLKDKNKLLQIEAKWCYRRAWKLQDKQGLLEKVQL